MTPEQFKRKLDLAARQIAAKRGDILLVGLKDLEGRMKQRIFNKGLNSDNSKIGNYSKGWAASRQKGKPVGTPPKGLQTSYIDLEFTGDLRKSITAGKDGNDAVLFMNNDEKYAISGYLEEQKKQVIFDATNREAKAVVTYIDELIIDEFNKAIKRI
jgi:hypothetical protein